MVSIDKLSLPPGQKAEPSKNLIASIKQIGITVPLEVFPNLVIFDGSKRFRAACLLGLTEVPIKVIPFPE